MFEYLKYMKMSWPEQSSTYYEMVTTLVFGYLLQHVVLLSRKRFNILMIQKIMKFKYGKMASTKAV